MQWIKRKIFNWVLTWEFNNEEYVDEHPFVHIWLDQDEDNVYYETNVHVELAQEMVEAIQELMADQDDVTSFH